jgi:hypothetical protein
VVLAALLVVIIQVIKLTDLTLYFPQLPQPGVVREVVVAWLVLLVVRLVAQEIAMGQ